jgi:ubiquilin
MAPQMANMLDNPAVLQQMATAMQDPAMIDTIIRMNPEMAGMAPQMREMFQSERFRQMMYVPSHSQV